MKKKAIDFFGRKKVWWNRLSTRRKVMYGIIGSAVVVVVILLIAKNKGTDGEIITIAPQEISKTVQVSGELESNVDLTLSFEKSGTIKSIGVSVGDNVKSGTIIASLEAAEEYADLKRAEGTLVEARDSLSTLESQLVSAKTSLSATTSAQNALVESSYRTLLSDDLVAEPTSKSTEQTPPDVRGLYTGPNEGTYKIRVEYENRVLDTHAEYKVSGLESDFVDNEIILGRYLPIATFGLSLKFPDDFSISSYDTDWTIAIPNIQGEQYASNFNAYQNALATRDLEIARAEAVVAEKEAQLGNYASTTKTAAILKAEADVASAYAKVENTIIRAYTSGKITKLNVQKGERVEAFQEVVVLQDINNLYVSADVNESNIVGIKPGQKVAVTFDALSEDQIFTGTVSDIDIAPTNTGNVTNYTITASIDTLDPILRPGMTANMTIKLFANEQVIAIPRRALIAKDEGWYVTILDEKDNKQEVAVVLGRDADGGLVEIISGLTETMRLWIEPQE